MEPPVEVDSPPLTAPRATASTAPRIGVLREIIEALTVAIVIAFTFKHYAFEAYKVPTGSMEPTIMGDAEATAFSREDRIVPDKTWFGRIIDGIENPKGGDHIIVDKMAYLLRQPRRFEVIVFRYPNNRSINYIKRVIGLPGESVFIVEGDIYVAPDAGEDATLASLLASGAATICRKSPGLREAIFDLFPEVAAADVDHTDEESVRRNWNLPNPNMPGAVEWTFADGEVVAKCGLRTLMRFRHAIRDNREFSPVGPTNQGGRFTVTDIRFSARVRPISRGGFVVVEMVDADLDGVILAKVPIAGNDDAGGFEIGGKRVKDFGGVRLAVGEETTITVENVDNALILRIDDEDVVVHEFEHPLPQGFVGDSKQGLAVGVEAGEAGFSRLAVHRDIYYQPGRPRSGGGDVQRYVVPHDAVFVLGDNSPSSKDSREWQRVTIKRPAPYGDMLVGDSEAVLDPDDLSRRIDNPWWDSGDGRKWFVDRNGTRHDLTDVATDIRVSIAPSPFVELDLVVGRAFAVFLPLARMKLVR